MASSDVYEVELYVHSESGAAWLVSEDGVEDDAVWIPKSQCTRGEETRRGSRVYEFEMPEWLARQKDLV